MRTLLTGMAMLAAVTLVPATAEARPRPVNEGGDTGPCVTSGEFDAVYLGMPRRRAERILDTHGHRVPVSELDDAFGDLPLGNRPPRRMVRAYPNCPDPSVTAEWTYVEYGTSHPKQAVTAMAFGS